MRHASPPATFRNSLPQTWTQGRVSGHPGWSRVSLGTTVLLRVSESVQVGVGPASGPASSEPGAPSILGRRWAVPPNLICALQQPQQRATSWGGWSPQAGGHEPRVRAEPAGQWPSVSCCRWRVSQSEQSPLGGGCSARCIPESQGCSPVALHQDSLVGSINWPPPQRGWDSSQVVDVVAYR